MKPWPALIVLFLEVLGLVIAVAKHGEPRDNVNALYVLISFVLTTALLWWGGFFDCLIGG